MKFNMIRELLAKYHRFKELFVKYNLFPVTIIPPAPEVPFPPPSEMCPKRLSNTNRLDSSGHPPVASLCVHKDRLFVLTGEGVFILREEGGASFLSPVPWRKPWTDMHQADHSIVDACSHEWDKRDPMSPWRCTKCGVRCEPAYVDRVLGELHELRQTAREVDA